VRSESGRTGGAWSLRLLLLLLLRLRLLNGNEEDRKMDARW